MSDNQTKYQILVAGGKLTSRICNEKLKQWVVNVDEKNSNIKEK